MDKMSMTSRLEYLARKQKRYLKTKTKENKSKLLDEICDTTGLHRKYVISVLAARISFKEKKERQRKKRSRVYDNTFTYYLKKIWMILDCPCGQRLEPVLGETADILIRHKEMKIPDIVLGKLRKVSSSTIDRCLARWKSQKRRRLHGTTKPGSLLKKQIPISLSRYNVKELGHSEIDLVAHNGGNPEGDFAHTLVETDLSSGWVEQEAFIGKARKRVKKSLEHIDKLRPFLRKSIDSDSGGEFINWLLYKWCQAEKILFTRGRPGKKNDNPHVEQKNWTHVRKLVGYHRYSTKKQINLLNDLYQNEWRLYENFFQPTVKLIEKKRIGGHLKKKYDKAKTPYKRIMESDEVTEEEKQKLTELYESLNPAELKRTIEKKLDVLFKTLRTTKGRKKRTRTN